jgi:tripartite-type tricarboxylate transporter receptor subunit TctC
MKRVVALAALLALAIAAGVADAQESYPSRPISIVAPFPREGVVDLTGRPLPAALERILKQPVVITNKAGAAAEKFWERDAASVATVIERIGKVEPT